MEKVENVEAKDVFIETKCQLARSIQSPKDPKSRSPFPKVILRRLTTEELNKYNVCLPTCSNVVIID